MLVGRDEFFKVIVVDYFGGDSYFVFFVDVVHKAVEFLGIGRGEARAEVVDGLFFFEVAGDSL